MDTKHQRTAVDTYGELQHTLRQPWHWFPLWVRGSRIGPKCPVCGKGQLNGGNTTLTLTSFFYRIIFYFIFALFI